MNSQNFQITLDSVGMDKLTTLLQQALTLEHQAYLQYLTHREQVRGPFSPAVMELLKDSAEDEARHAGLLRSLLSDFLRVVPSAAVAPVQPSNGSLPDVISVNLAAEQDAIILYRQIYSMIRTMREIEPDMVFKWFSFEKIIREIIAGEEEHIVELERLK